MSGVLRRACRVVLSVALSRAVWTASGTVDAGYSAELRPVVSETSAPGGVLNGLRSLLLFLTIPALPTSGRALHLHAASPVFRLQLG